MASKWRSYYKPIPINTETPYLAVGGTVFGPHDGIVRRSFVLAFAPGFETEVKAADQRLAQMLADRLNNHPEIAQTNPPLELVELIIRKHAAQVVIECGGCGLWLEATLDNFHSKAHGGGLHTYCKSCRGKICKNYLHKKKMGWIDD